MKPKIYKKIKKKDKSKYTDEKQRNKEQQIQSKLQNLKEMTFKDEKSFDLNPFIQPESPVSVDLGSNCSKEEEEDLPDFGVNKPQKKISFNNLEEIQ